MNTTTQTIKIINDTHGVLMNETFINAIQFKLFLKMINGCLNSSENLTFFNGEDFLVNIPNTILKASIIVTSANNYTLADHMINKSKIEQIA
jgi:PleD family two-component response regulator